MGIKESHSEDKDGTITQIDYTEERADGKIETRHVNPDSKQYTGKSVHNPGTGKTKYYTREEANMGGCFITTSCLKALNLPEDSLEFKAMEVLTKEHILKSLHGKRDYIRYLKKAPQIVESIEARSDSQKIWEDVYSKLRDITNLVSNKKYGEGYDSYKSLVMNLDAKVLSNA